MKIPFELCTETGTPTEPITTSYAKNHLRVDISDDDTLIANLVTAAREYCERYCNRSFTAHTYRADLPAFWDKMELPYQPIQSITNIKYYDTASPSVLQTLSSAVYALSNGVIRRQDGQSWQSVYPRADAVQITFTTGYRDNSSPVGTGELLPEAVKAAMLLVVGDLYENREMQIAYPGQLHSNRTVHMLLDAYRNYQ